MNNTVNEVHPPWYKQFWPWFLIALPGSVVIASIFTIIIATDNPDTVVVDDYYKQGLAINRNISREQLATQLGILATLNMTDNKIIISLKSDQKIQHDYLILRLMHPTLADKDQQLKLNKITPTTYSAEIKAVSAGNWNFRLEGYNPDWRIQKRVIISTEASQYTMP